MKKFLRRLVRKSEFRMDGQLLWVEDVTELIHTEDGGRLIKQDTTWQEDKDGVYPMKCKKCAAVFTFEKTVIEVGGKSE